MTRSARSLTVVGVLLDSSPQLRLRELSRVSGLDAEALIRMVEEGVLEPSGDSPMDWVFPARDLLRLQTLVRLQRDLGLNLPGAALALDLLEEVRDLRARVRALECWLE